MPRTARDSFDEPEDEDDEFESADGGAGLSDRDDPDPADQDDDIGDERADTIPCPFCRKSVYEGADICPHCRNFVAAEDAPRRIPWWIWAGVILCLVAVLLWVF